MKRVALKEPAFEFIDNTRYGQTASHQSVASFYSPETGSERRKENANSYTKKTKPRQNNSDNRFTLLTHSHNNHLAQYVFRLYLAKTRHVDNTVRVEHLA